MTAEKWQKKNRNTVKKDVFFSSASTQVNAKRDDAHCYATVEDNKINGLSLIFFSPRALSLSRSPLLRFVFTNDDDTKDNGDEREEEDRREKKRYLQSTTSILSSSYFIKYHD